jgi:hypothetical protein
MGHSNLFCCNFFLILGQLICQNFDPPEAKHVVVATRLKSQQYLFLYYDLNINYWYLAKV